MEVILIKDLKRKGSFGDIIEVADGYARNYLIPNGFALIANNANRKRFEEIKGKAMADVEERRKSLNLTADKIKGKTFSMTALSRDGKLYGSISPSIIVNEMIKKELPDINVGASDIIIEAGNIKFVGTYNCKAQFTKSIFADFKILIESDESDEQPELLEAIVETDKKELTKDEFETDVVESDADSEESEESEESLPLDSPISEDEKNS
jgi:large subunit ribosomal protein L9